MARFVHTGNFFVSTSPPIRDRLQAACAKSQHQRIPFLFSLHRDPSPFESSYLIRVEQDTKSQPESRKCYYSIFSNNQRFLCLIFDTKLHLASTLAQSENQNTIRTRYHPEKSTRHIIMARFLFFKIVAAIAVLSVIQAQDEGYYNGNDDYAEYQDYNNDYNQEDNLYYDYAEREQQKK